MAEAAAPTKAADTPPVAAGSPNPLRAVSLSVRASFVVQVMLGLSNIELARALGEQDRGRLAAAMLWPTVIAGIGALGLLESVTYHTASAPERVRHILGSSLALAAIQTVVIGAVDVAVIPIVLGSKGSTTVEAAWIYSSFIPFVLVATVLIGILNGLHRYRPFNFVRMSIFIFMLIGQTALIVFGKSSVIVLAIILAASQAAATTGAAILVWRALRSRPRWDRRTMRSVLHYGVRSNAGTTASFLNQRLDQLVLAAFLPAGQLGLYIVAVNLTQPASLIGTAVAFAALPNVSSMSDERGRVTLARRLVGLTLLSSALLAVPVLILADPLISLLFGSSFLASTDVARVLALGAIVFASARALEAVLRGVGKPLDAGIAELVALIGTAAGLAVLVPALGIMGAGLTSLAAYGISCAWMVWRATRALEVPPHLVLLPDRELLTALKARLGRRRRGAQGLNPVDPS